MPSSFTLSLAATLAASFVAAQPLAVWYPCTECQSPPPAITVTEIYQPVSTCSAVSTCPNGACTTTYSYSTFPWVSTVIPCAGAASTTTVTCVEQPITVSAVTSTVTSTVTCTGSPATPTTAVTTWVKEYVAPYQAIGPSAISGYGGSGLCSACEANEAGMLSQIYNVTECWTCNNEVACVGYPEVVVQSPSPSVTATVTATCTSTATVTAAGTYTYSFLQTCPATTITAAATTTVCPAQTYYAVVTTACAAATVFEIEATVTQAVGYEIAIQTCGAGEWLAFIGASMSTWWSNAPPAAPAGWNNWSPPAPASPGAGYNGGVWNNWVGTASVSTTGATYVVPPVPTATGPALTPFFVTVQDPPQPNVRFAKRQVYGYLDFQNSQAQTTDNSASQAIFTLDNSGDLKTGGQFVGSSDFNTNQPLEEFQFTPNGPHVWSIGSSNILNLSGASGFCLLNNAIEVLVPSQSTISGCTPVVLVVNGALTTSTTSSMASSTTSMMASSTASATTTSPVTACSNIPPFLIQVNSGATYEGQELVLNTNNPSDQGELTFADTSELGFMVQPDCEILTADGNQLEIKMINNIGEKVLYDGGSDGTPVNCMLNPSSMLISCNGSQQFWAQTKEFTGPTLLFSTQVDPGNSGAEEITLIAVQPEDC